MVRIQITCEFHGKTGDDFFARIFQPLKMLDMAAAELQKIKGFCDRFLVLHTQEYERLKIEVQKIEFATVTELTRYCEIAMKASTSERRHTVEEMPVIDTILEGLVRDSHSAKTR